MWTGCYESTNVSYMYWYFLSKTYKSGNLNHKMYGRKVNLVFSETVYDFRD